MKLQFDRKFYQTLFVIAIPIALQNLVTSSLNFIDVFMINKLSTEAISGVGIANKVYFLLNLFLFGTNSGAAILASQYWGVKDVKSIKKVLGLTLMIGLGVSTVFTIGSLVFTENIIGIFTSEKLVIEQGSMYLETVAFSYIFTAVTFGYSFLLRTTHNTKLPMVVTSIALLFNTFFNWVLIYGKLGAPALGVQGAAIATVGARIVECSFLLFITYRNDLPLAARFSEMLGFSKAFAKHYFNTVIFVIMNEVIWALGVVGYSIVYGRMGSMVMASVTVAQTVEQISFVIFFGLCNACGVMLGNVLGANDLQAAEQYAKRFMKIVSIISVITSVIIFATAGWIAGLFEAGIQRNVILCLRVFAIFMPFKVLNMLVIVGILRSGGDTVASLLIDLIGVWFVGLPLGILGGLVWHLPIQYVYALVLMEEASKVILCMIRYRSKKWVKNLVMAPQ